MKIAIDVQTTLGQKSGFGFYVSNLVKNLQEIDQNNQYLLIEPRMDHDLSTPQRVLWDQIGFPTRACNQGADIIHQPCFSAPIIPRRKTVVTIHDLISIHFPQNLPLFSRLFYSKLMPFSYRFADAYITISEHSKKDILKILDLGDKDIKVIHEAAGEEYRPLRTREDKERIEQIKEKYGVKGPYALHIATLEPRKNLPFLVQAFAEVIKDPEIKHSLVITGKKGWYYEELFDLVEKLNLQQRVLFTGYVQDEDLPYMYNGADLFTFPSIYEGFGLPPLEAISCGVPVLSSNTSSLPEVVGDAGILASPTDKEEWVKQIKRVLKDPKLQKKMSGEGLRQAQKFSWRKNAEETIKVYESLL